MKNLARSMKIQGTRDKKRGKLAIFRSNFRVLCWVNGADEKSTVTLCADCIAYFSEGLRYIEDKSTILDDLSDLFVIDKSDQKCFNCDYQPNSRKE